MVYVLFAGLVVVIHLVFVLFVLLGGFLAIKWKRLAWIHLPAALWGALIEFAGWLCPLTPLEIFFREKAGAAGYETGFIEHYLLPVLYPSAMTRFVQITLGILVLGVNVRIYGWLVGRRMKSKG